MMQATEYQSPNYYDVFRPLLSIHPHFNVSSLVEVELEQKIKEFVPAPVGFFSSFSAQTRVPTPEQQNKMKQKLLRRKIKDWTYKIDEELEKTRYQPKDLPKLKEVMSKIFHENRFTILQTRMQELFQKSMKNQKVIARLGTLIKRVLGTPNLERLNQARSDSSPGIVSRYPIRKPMAAPKGNGFAALCSLLPPSSNKTKIKRSRSDGELWKKSTKGKEISPLVKMDPQKLQQKIQLEKHQMHRDSCAKEVSVYDPKWGKGWEDKFLGGFKEANEQNLVCAIASNLDTMQALLVIHCLLHDQRQEWKLIFLIGSLDYLTFVEVLNSVPLGTLSQLNEILRRSSQKETEWFEKAFEHHRDGFIKSCNRMKGKIDELARRFRTDMAGITITRIEIEKMAEFRDNIELRVKGIKDKLGTLIEGVIMHPETRHVLYVGIIKEYRVLLTRLGETREYEERPAGCLLPILFRNVFETAELDDNDEATEIFRPWSLWYGEDYWNAGVFGKIDEEQFKKLKAMINMFTLGSENLRKLGIVKIVDWKRLMIFNRTMLVEYLENEDRRAKLTQWTLEALPK